MKTIFCPICDKPAVVTKSPNEGCEMFVAEQTGTSIECFDLIIMYECEKKHTFYISEKAIK